MLLGRLTRRSAFMAGPEASILLPLMEWWPNAMSGTLQRATEMGARSSSLYGQYVKPIKIFIDDEEKEFLFQEDIAPFLRSLGYAYSTSQINKLCAPAVNEGPPIALWHGPRPLRTPMM